MARPPATRAPTTPHAPNRFTAGAERSAWNASGRRLLALFPHPDDEAYAAGGLLARCARAGAAVELVCATRGERGTDRTGAADGARLAALRTHELAASCRALGIDPPRFLDLPDGELAAADRTAVDLLSEELQHTRPHVVVTLGSDGVYANLDHMAWTAAVGAAVQGCADPPRLLHAVFPRGLFLPVWRALRRRRGARIVAEVDPQSLGVAAADADLRVDVRPVRDRKLAAVAAHRSQLADGDPLTFLRPGIVERLLDEEWYIVAHGPALPPGADEPFAGL
jgi:N-acetyl-1-D-myo-inositol-2-amino-2-deoxy-alpha-D-glucopyranoside deacetylase